MKRYKRVLVLLIILVAACALTFGVTRYQEVQEQIAASEEIILDIPTSAVTALSWELEDRSFSFTRDEDWVYDEDPDFPVDAEEMEYLLSRFESFSVSFVIDDVEDYAQYGLEDPVCTIHITTATEDFEILLGSYSTLDQERYVSIGDGKVYLVSSDPMDRYDVELNDLIDQDEIPVFDHATTISVSGPSDYEISYQEDSDRAYTEDDRYYTDDAVLDPALVEDYLSTVAYLDLTDYVTYKATEADLTTYGLDDPDLTLQVDYVIEPEDEDGTEEHGRYTLTVSRDPEEAAAEAEAAEAEAETAEEADAETADDAEEETFTAYARVGDSPIIYQITQAEYEALLACTASDLRYQALFPFPFDQVVSMTVALEGRSFALTSEVTEEDGEEVRTFYVDGEELAIDDLSAALTALTASSFGPDVTAGEEEIRLTIQLDNEHYPEVELALYRVDGTSCLAEVDGTPLALIPRTQAIDLVEAVQAFALNASN